MCKHEVLYHSNHNGIGHQFTFGDVFVGLIAEVGSGCALRAQQIPGGNML